MFFISILLLCEACDNDKIENVKTVENVDIAKYMGKWYEIARFDHSFERGLVGCTAEYQLQKNGKIKVINSGFKDNLTGKKSSAIGWAKLANPKISGHLKVSFFLWFYANYYILVLEPKNYDYALIGSSSKSYLWILSRTPQLAQEKIDYLLSEAKKLGYDITKFIFVAQSQNFSEK